ncbi:hydroxysqualene dehydroxylase HpnE [Rhodoplanes sp. SY1]|uniref:hydroxysqualene dehydroxylase HpnE n=1 Tax=Rhodoplanes sp. SY1 TaxID=3166646 RepID=UPI0038B6821F
MVGAVHIIGAGLAGLAAAVRLAGSGRRITVHEGSKQAGGRCRSYHDAATGLYIDNGNHLLLSANQAALDYAATLGTADRLHGPAEAAFDFFDLRTRTGWRLRIDDGRIPWWIFDPQKRVPGTSWRDYVALAKLMFTGERPLGEVIPCKGALHERLIEPLMVAALNTAPPVASAALARNIVRETLAKGGACCRPLVATGGLGTVFVEPALDHLRARDVSVLMTHELRALVTQGDRVTALDFGDETIALGPDDAVILAVPAWTATALVPGLAAPTEFRSILNTHFRTVAPPGTPPLVGVIGGTAEWIFVFPDRVSVTTSNADRFMKEPREKLAQTIWDDVRSVIRLTDEALPAWQIVRERRATFAATPEQNALRPGPRTAWRNLALAGDWTDTGLPATIEGAIRSGNTAAALI